MHSGQMRVVQRSSDIGQDGYIGRRCLDITHIRAAASRRPDPRFKPIKVLPRLCINAELSESLSLGLGFHKNIASSRITLPNTWTFGDGLALHWSWADKAVSWVVDSILGSGIGTGNGIVVLGI